jgi:serine/threonine protein phosphatase PrpC
MNLVVAMNDPHAVSGQNRLVIQAGFCSLKGRRLDNQDYVGYTAPTPRELDLRGAVAAIADGMGGARGGRTAAEVCVRCFLDAYYSLPETLGIEQRAARCLESANRWIHAVGRRDGRLAGMATTFSALILWNRQAHLIHAGDTRIYRLRGEQLERLTDDHTFKHPDMDHVLYRAVGIESALCADYAAHALERHDRFLLCTDGLYASLRDSELHRILLERTSPDSSAERLVNMALAQGSQDNITALIVDVIALPPATRPVLQELIEVLPIEEPPVPGQTVDGFYLIKILSSGRYSRLFVARDERTGKDVVLKFPHPRVASEREYQNAFLREAWIGARIHSPWIAEIIELPPGRQTRLYSVLPYYPGQTLEWRIAHSGKIGLTFGIDIALKLCKALHTLHRQRVIHRDIKPDNILLQEDGGLRLLDLGVARLAAWDEDAGEPIPGTPSYMAPEQFHGDRGSEASDIFALGVTLYRLFTRGAYPYGEIEPFSTPRFHKLRSLSAQRPDLPVWLDSVLAKALAVDLRDRYADVMELSLDLENGLAKGGQTIRRKVPLYGRNPILFWQVVSLVLLLLLAISLANASATSRRPERGRFPLEPPYCGFLGQEPINARADAVFAPAHTMHNIY